MKGYLAYDLDRCACERGEVCGYHVSPSPHAPGPTPAGNAGPGLVYGLCPICAEPLRGDREIFHGVCHGCAA